MHTAMPRGEGASIEDNLARVVDELNRTVEFYHSNHPESPLKTTPPLLLTGKLSGEPAVGQYFQEAMDYPVGQLVPQMELPPGFPTASYAANIGLALKKTRGKVTAKKTAEDKGTSYYDINLNLLPAEYRAESHQAIAGRILIPALLVIAIGLIFPAYLVRDNATAETERLETQLTITSEELRQIRIEADEAIQTEESITQLSTILETLQQQQNTLTHVDNAADNLKMLTEAIDQNGYLTSIEVEGDQVIVQGQAESLADVISYVDALNRLDYFSEVRIAEFDKSDIIEPTEPGDPLETNELETSFTIIITR